MPAGSAVSLRRREGRRPSIPPPPRGPFPRPSRFHRGRINALPIFKDQLILYYVPACFKPARWVSLGHQCLRGCILYQIKLASLTIIPKKNQSHQLMALTSKCDAIKPRHVLNFMQMKNESLPVFS